MEKQLALIVEDNALLSNLFSRALKDIGYETLVLGNGRAAQEWLQTQTPDVIFLDMHLPEVTGKTIFDGISTDARFEKVHTVIITADARMGEMLAEKASFVLIKPVDIDQLKQLGERLQNR